MGKVRFEKNCAGVLELSLEKPGFTLLFLGPDLSPGKWDDVFSMANLGQQVTSSAPWFKINFINSPGVSLCERIFCNHETYHSRVWKIVLGLEDMIIIKKPAHTVWNKFDNCFPVSKMWNYSQTCGYSQTLIFTCRILKITQVNRLNDTLKTEVHLLPSSFALKE